MSVVETVRSPRNLLDRLPEIVARVIQAKRDFLTEKFGDASDFGIRGFVVVGTIGRGIATGRLDALSVYVVTDKPGYDVDFCDNFGRKSQRRVIREGTILIGVGQEFTNADWQKEREKRGLENRPYRIIIGSR